MNADRAGVGDRVTLVTGPALETLAGIAGPFDFAYIDADKGSYPQYLDAVVERLRPGGVVALDNLLWLGQAAHEPEDSEFSSRVDADHPRLQRGLSGGCAARHHDRAGRRRDRAGRETTVC